jgi:hypothetical protein
MPNQVELRFTLVVMCPESIKGMLGRLAKRKEAIANTAASAQTPLGEL